MVMVVLFDWGVYWKCFYMWMFIIMFVGIISKRKMLLMIYNISC